MDDFKKASTVELENMRDELEVTLMTIRSQIETAKAKAQAHNEYSDIDWFSRANFSLKKTGLNHQRILRELGVRRKASDKARSEELTHKFINVARRRLEPMVFDEFMAEAKASIL